MPATSGFKACTIIGFLFLLVGICSPWFHLGFSVKYLGIDLDIDAYLWWVHLFVVGNKDTNLTSLFCDSDFCSWWDIATHGNLAGLYAFCLVMSIVAIIFNIGSFASFGKTKKARLVTSGGGFALQMFAVLVFASAHTSAYKESFTGGLLSVVRPSSFAGSNSIATWGPVGWAFALVGSVLLGVAAILAYKEPVETYEPLADVTVTSFNSYVPPQQQPQQYNGQQQYQQQPQQYQQQQYQQQQYQPQQQQYQYQPQAISATPKV